MLLEMYERMDLIRSYEEALYYLFLEGTMPGSIHQSHGQEACAVGMLYGLRNTDYMASTHRPAGHDIAKGVSVRDMMCEMFGKEEGCCKGRGGAMHTGDITVGAIPANAIVGANIPISTGIGLSLKLQKRDDVVICFFGDGASNEGAFHEGLNGAAIWDLPVIFVCENNLYGASTSIKEVLNIDNIASRADAYGMPSEIVDGNDVLAVYEAAQRAIDRARKGEGPTLLELKTYRIAGHSRSDGCAYREDDEESEWFSRDPIELLKEKIISEKIADEQTLINIHENNEKAVDEAIEYAIAAKEPSVEEVLLNVYWEGN